MKIIIVYCLLFVVSSFSFAQNKYVMKEEKLQLLKKRSDIKVIEVEKDILKLEYPNGKVMYKNISDYRPLVTDNLNYSPTFDSTIIDLTTIDTTLYSHKYKFWQEVPIFNWDFDYVRIADLNNNGKKELYGARKFFLNDFEPITVYELNDAESFIPIYQYDSVYIVRNIYDVDNDTKEEVQLTLPPIFDTVGNQQRFFSKENNTSLATQLNFTFVYGTGAQLNDQTLGDFDNDDNTDLLFIRFDTPSIYINEYNTIINNFDSVYRFDINERSIGGFSVGDFDIDEKTDIVFSTITGKVFIIENEGNNQYTNSWQGSVESYNTYYHTCTNDIDKNGKPEFWISGHAYYNGIGTTRINIFETDGDNSYQIVGRIDLVGSMPFYAGNMQPIDIDKDGIEEVAICIDNNFLILKFSGSENHHIYEIYYIKQNELNTEEEYQTYVGAVMSDLQSTGDYEILISMYHSVEVQPSFYNSRYITKIYKPDSTTSVNNDEIIPSFLKLYQNFPNPFNPSTNISFGLSKSEVVSIKVYNILGKEIKLLFEENLPSGEHSILWDGKDNKGNLLPGGIYFIQMTAGVHKQTIKTVILK
jgi:hypothetical protein